MSLHELFDRYGHTKCVEGEYNYLPIYERVFERFRYENIVILEAGVGGYEGSQNGGNSLMVWRDYFPNAQIVGVDIYDKSFFDGDRVKTIKCSQTDIGEIWRNIEPLGRPSIIIDDGSHFSPDIITTFEGLYPILMGNGLYIIEDLHTSYYDRISSIGEDFGGGIHENTSMNYFKRITDELNYDEASRLLPLKHLEIKSIEFFKSLIIINK